MSQPTDFAIGDRALWAKEARGGYGFITFVPVVVIGHGRKRCCVLVPRLDGDVVARWCSPENLRRREKPHAVDLEYARLFAVTTPAPVAPSRAPGTGDQP